MSSNAKTHKVRTMFGIKEEHIVAMMMVPLLFGCLFTEPFIVEVENFNSGSPSEILAYGPGGGTDSVEFNVSKYAAIGNWTHDSIFTSFTVQLCPTSGTPSNITMHWPYTGNSIILWAGNLGSCQNVSVDTSGFDSHFRTEMMQVIDLTVLLTGSMPNMTYNTMMLREPHMHHISEDVWFTMAAPGAIPQEIVNMTGYNISITDIRGIAYTCYPGDSLRYVYQPAVVINTSLLMGNISFPLPLPVNLTSFTDATAHIYDMPCPPYVVEGKYRAEIKKVNMTIANATLNYTENIFFDDFDGSSLGASWLVFSQQGPEIAYYEDNWASGTYDMYSLTNGSGIITYYNRTLPINDNNNVVAEFNLSTAEIYSFALGQSIGVQFFSNETVGPGSDAEIGSYIRGMFMIANDTWGLVCPDMDMPGGSPIAMGAYAPGWHTFKMNFTNDTQYYYVDGVNVFNCTNYTNENLFIGVSSDPLTNQLLGNMSVEWANVTTYAGGAVSSTMFDDFNAPLDTSRWLPMVVNETYAYYEVHDSKLWLYSNSPSNASGIIAYLINPPLLNPQELADNITSMNLSNYTNFTGFTIDEAGWEVTISMDSSDANATDYSLGLFLMNFTWPPSANITDINDSFRGGFVLNGTAGVAICPNGTVLGAGPVAPANYTFGFLSTNRTFDMYVDGGYIGSCPPVNETLVLSLTSDSSVEMFESGKFSVNDISASVFASVNGSGNFWIEVPPGYAYADVIVCDCNDRWNRPYEFNISSDSQGTVNISIVNISYESLIGYASPVPSVNIDSNSMFSWMAYDSNITNSEIRFQTGIGRSNIINSDIIMADIDCADVSNSDLTVFIYNSKNLSKLLIDAGIPDPGIPFPDMPCGRIENSTVLAGVFIGGDVIDSELYNMMMAFTDFHNANVNNLYLSTGNMTMNFTRWAPNLSNYSMALPSLGFEELPLGCHEDAIFSLDGAPYLTLSEANATYLDCWLRFINSDNVTLDNVRFNNTLHGPTITLDNATVTLTNMEYDFNVKLKQPYAHATIWGLNTNDTGDIVLSSDHIHTDNSMFSMNSSYYPFLDTVNVTVVFEGITQYDGIYYHPEFTSNYVMIVQNGTLCDNAQCRNLMHDAVSGELSFDTNNFSSYAIVRFDAPFTPPGGSGSDDDDFLLSYELICPDDMLRITAVDESSGLPVSDVRAALQQYVADHYEAEGTEYTNFDGIAEFGLSEEGSYRLLCGKNGYNNAEMTFDLVLCSEEEPEEPEEEPEIGQEVPETEPSEEMTEEPEEIVEEEPEEAVPEEPFEEAPEEGTGEPATALDESGGECCFFGICAAVLGICWYWWLLFVILGIFVVFAGGALFAVGKGRKKYKPPKTLKGII